MKFGVLTFPFTVVHSCCWYVIPLCEYPTMYLAVLLLVNIWVVSYLVLLVILPLWKSWVCLCEYMFNFFLQLTKVFWILNLFSVPSVPALNILKTVCLTSLLPTWSKPLHSWCGILQWLLATHTFLIRVSQQKWLSFLKRK